MRLEKEYRYATVIEMTEDVAFLSVVTPVV